MSYNMKRRSFITKAGVGGAGLIGIAGAWTSWDLIQPLPTSGFGGKVRTVAPTAVPDKGVLEVPAARAYLGKDPEGIVVAYSEKCSHLGCRVPFCESSSQFECPCHGSVFNQSGDYITGPAPRGMDQYPVELGDDGLLYIDTGSRMDGPAPGTFVLDEPATGPACEAEGH